jgi:outer membrane protein
VPTDARWLACAALAAVTGCAALTRPEGDGGWSAERRRETITTAARDAGTRFAEPEARDAAITPRMLDLASSLELAAKENRRLAVARAGLEAEASRVDRALGRFLPVTTASGRYTWYTDPQTNSLSEFPGELAPGARPPSVTVRDSEAGTVTGTIEVPIDWAGELRKSLAAAQAGYRGEAARVAAIELEEQANVVRAYFGLLEAKRLREVANDRVGLLGEQMEHARSRFDAGRLTLNEKLVVEVALANAKHERYRRDLDVAHQRSALNRAVGLPIAAPTDVADVAVTPELPVAESLLGVAREQNPVLRGLLEERQRLEARESALARTRLPRLSAGGNVEATTSDILQPQEIGSGFVAFRWDLGTDLQRETEIAETRRLAKQNEKRLEEELRGLEDALTVARDALEERLKALDVARGAVGQAEENLRIRRQQFDAGRSTSDDVLDAETLLTSERAAVASALYQSHVRRAELLRLAGLSPSADLR